MRRRRAPAGRALCAALALAAAPAAADIPGNRIDIGIISDALTSSGQPEGGAAVVAATMAAEDFGTEAGPVDVEVYRAALAAAPGADLDRVRRWLSHDQAAVVLDAAGSTQDDAAIADLMIARGRMLITAALTDDPGPALCRPQVAKWGSYPAIVAHTLAAALAARGRHRVSIIADQSPYGAALSRDLAALMPASAGLTATAVGGDEFRQRLLAAQTAKADALVLAMQGPGLVDVLRAAAANGLPERLDVVAPAASLTDFHHVGLPEAGNLFTVGDFYWDQSAATKAFVKRLGPAIYRDKPHAIQATVYAAVMAYLHAARATHSIDSDTIMAEWRRAAAQTGLFASVSVLPDGRVAHAMYLYRVRGTAGTGAAWQDYELAATVPAEQAYAGPCGPAAAPPGQ
jgi:branched-chain amino acid transport system substrate-binding protein